MRCLLILAPAVALVPSQRAARRPSALNTATATPPVALEVGAQALDWPNIGFEFRETRSFVRYQFRNGAWDEGAEYPGGLDATVPVSVGATALHYGQSLFEGLKAFACKDGSVRLFRPDRNAARMANGAARTLMAAPDRAGTKRRGAFEMHCAVFGADRGTAAGARRGYSEGTRTRGRRSTAADDREEELTGLCGPEAKGTAWGGRVPEHLSEVLSPDRPRGRLPRRRRTRRSSWKRALAS